MTANDLAAEIADMYGYCVATYNEHNIDEVNNRLTVLSGYLARSAELMGEAQYLRDHTRGKWSEHPQAEKMNATRYRDWLASKVKDEERLLVHTERLNRTITHMLDALRTQLSFAKQLLPQSEARRK